MRGVQLCRICLRSPIIAGPSRRIYLSSSSTPFVRSYSSPRDPTSYPPDDAASRTISSDAQEQPRRMFREIEYDEETYNEALEGGGEEGIVEGSEGETQQELYSFDLPDPDILHSTRTPFGIRTSENQITEGRNPYPSKIVWKDRNLIDEEELDEEELDALREAGRRKRKTDAKRRQKGGFADHIVLKVRGGKGGSGTAAFGATTTGSLGPPAGGNGGSGGSVYLTTSTQLTSLHTLRRRYRGGQGANGAGDSRHGAKGEDVLLEVPVGTVLREIAREGDEEKHWEIMERDEVPMEERRKIRWTRWFTAQTGHHMEDSYFNSAERLLRREKKWVTRTPTFEEVPPLVYDLGEEVEEPILIQRGGAGGMGNPFFHGLDYRAPRIASRGLLPYTSTFEVELKILADVGLVGFPNAGKSTILRALTGSKAEVASYQFTTLNPQVGVVRVWDDGSFGGGGLNSVGDGGVVEETWKERNRDTQARQAGEYLLADRMRTTREIEAERVDDKMEAYRFTISDNPGLLPQASENVGLGHSFLRSIERSLALAYILDIKRPNPAEDLLSLRDELEAYKAGLGAKGAVIVLNKGDEVDGEEGQAKVNQVREAMAELDEGGKLEIVVLSGKYGLGLEKLVRALGQKVEAAREELRREEEDTGDFPLRDGESNQPEVEEGGWTQQELEERDILI